MKEVNNIQIETVSVDIVPLLGVVIAAVALGYQMGRNLSQNESFMVFDIPILIAIILGVGVALLSKHRKGTGNA